MERSGSTVPARLQPRVTMRGPEGWWKPEAPRGCGGGSVSPGGLEAGPQNKPGAGRGAAGGQIPPLPEGSALLAATAADAAAAAASGHGPARRPRPRRTGAGRRGAPSSARGRRAARGHGVRLRAQPGGGEQGTAGAAAGLGRRGLPGGGALLGGGPRPGAPRARRRLPSPRGCTPGARRGGWRRFGVPAGAPTPRRRRRRSAVSRTPAPPARYGSDPVFDRCALRPPPPHPIPRPFVVGGLGKDPKFGLPVSLPFAVHFSR